MKLKGLYPSFVNIAYVWSIVFIAIVLYALVWFVCGYFIMEFIEAIEAAYTFQPPLDSTVDIVKSVVAWHPIIALFGWILWGFLNSLRRDVKSFEM